MKRFYSFFFLTIVLLLPSILYSQTEYNDAEQAVSDSSYSEDDLDFAYQRFRTNIWSIYAEGGIPYAIGTEIQNINPSTKTYLSPAAGIGFSFYIRPWIRIGAGYEYVKYRTQQRFNELQPIDQTFFPNPSESLQLINKEGGLANRDFWSQYHNVGFNLEFNLLGFSKYRRQHAFNLYIGSGAGYAFINGNTHTVAMGKETWGVVNGNQPEQATDITEYSYFKTWNEKHTCQAITVPANISFEYDINPQFTIGIKGQYRFFFSNQHSSPKGVASALISLRYTFVGKKQNYYSYRHKYEECMMRSENLEKGIIDTIVLKTTDTVERTDTVYIQPEIPQPELYKPCPPCPDTIYITRKDTIYITHKDTVYIDSKITDTIHQPRWPNPGKDSVSDKDPVLTDSIKVPQGTIKPTPIPNDEQPNSGGNGFHRGQSKTGRKLTISEEDGTQKEIIVEDTLAVYFGYGRYTLDLDNAIRLIQYLEKLNLLKDYKISLLSQTSAEGDPEKNQKLSERRLETVMIVLKRAGIKSSNIISAQAIGSKKRIHNWYNHKVEIILHPKE